ASKAFEGQPPSVGSNPTATARGAERRAGEPAHLSVLIFVADFAGSFAFPRRRSAVDRAPAREHRARKCPLPEAFAQVEGVSRCCSKVGQVPSALNLPTFSAATA